MSNYFAAGLGLSTLNQNGDPLEAYFPLPLLNVADATIALFSDALKDIATLGNTQSTYLLDANALRTIASALQTSTGDAQAEQLSSIASTLIDSKRQPVLVLLRNDEAPSTVAEAYLKLHLLSHRLVKPHQVNLDGIFASLPNVAWTNHGPVDLEELPARQLRARADGDWLNVKSVDKFPAMTDYVVPNGVRIADTARVRLGAYIGEGTTIMHEGFVNFNAGTAGTSMIEGRISAGVFVGEGSDLGGGCSTMGTLSGGGNIVIAVGENCLIGANAGVGIGLGDRCTVEAGLYICLLYTSPSPRDY